MTPGRRLRPAVVSVLLALVAAAPAPSQPAPDAYAEPFADSGTRRIWEAAVSHARGVDDSLVQYVAVVKQRMAAGIRMPLKDRTLYRAEGATRVFWTRGGSTVVQVLGARERTPTGWQEGTTRLGLFDATFDPLDDRLLFGLVEVGDSGNRDGDDLWFEHPLEPRWRNGYRFSSGDTLTVTLPDGARLRVVELVVVPTEADVHRMVGSLWIAPETGALVRAVFRLSETFDAFRDVPDLREEEDEDLRHLPEVLKPVTFDLSLVAVDYAWWEGDVWLPRTLRAEGTARAGFLSAPATVELAYTVESVVTDADLEAEARAGAPVEERRFATRSEAMAFLADRVGEGLPYRLEPDVTRTGDARGRGRTVRWLVPEDPSLLAESPALPPPVWEEGPGFPDHAEVARWEEVLRDLPSAPGSPTPWTFRWGLQRTDLVRYNRVEGLSVGARAQLRPQTPVGPLSLSATVRMGTGDQVPNIRVDATRETLARRVTASAYHELAAVDRRARNLRLGNTVTALLFGRDDGDYYRRSGMAVGWTPPAARRQSFEVRGYAEYHRPAAVETDFALWDLAGRGRSFRPNLQAREGWEAGALVALRPWWGTDPLLVQGGLDLTLRAAGGDWSYARASLEGRLAVPLPGALRLGFEAGGGGSWGDPPPQRHFLLGGAGTLRGYAPRTLEGTTYLRARTELARRFAFGAVSLFGDAAWAADGWRAPSMNQVWGSVGAGLSLVDGLIRLDGAWGLRDPRSFRLELYLDGIL